MMALSVMGGEYGEHLPLAANPVDDVLCELNAEFHQSKSELIQRFLKDQEDLNERFAEYALNSDEGDGDGEGSEVSLSTAEVLALLPGGHPGHPSSLRDGSGGSRRDAGKVFDILQDIEEKDMMDNLSTTSAINSSSDAPSLSDVDDHLSHEDLNLNEGKDHDENWNVTRQRAPGTSSDSKNYDQHNHEARPMLNSALSEESNTNTHLSNNTAQSRKPKKPKEGTPTRKVKKVLMKKNVRPQTAVGVRGLTDRDDPLCANNSDRDSLKPKVHSAGAPTFSMQDSIKISARLKKISWTGGTEEHPEFGRLSISASVHKRNQRSHTPSGRLKSFSGPLLSTNTLGSLRGFGYSDRHSTNEADNHRGSNHNPDSTEHHELIRHEALLRSSTPLCRPDSSKSNRSLISMDFGHDRLSGYGSRRAPVSGVYPQTLIRNGVYSTERGGRLVMTSSRPDVKGKKRPIAVLKLPPLDSSVVNRAIGAAGMEAAGHQPALVSPPTAKTTSVATPSAI